MTTRKDIGRRKAAHAARDEAGEMSKAELEQQLAETRESLAHTVHEIKDTVTGQYEAVRETVTGVIDYREQFQKEPLVWSLGALSALRSDTHSAMHIKTQKAPRRSIHSWQHLPKAWPARSQPSARHSSCPL